VECRCGGQTTEMPCSDVVAVKSQGGAEAVYTCDRRCNKKMSCSRHKCGQFCCVGADHQCRLICGCTFYTLSLKIHFVFIHNLVNVSSTKYGTIVEYNFHNKYNIQLHTTGSKTEMIWEVSPCTEEYQNSL